MRKELQTWLGKEFIWLTSEAKPGANATDETRELFQGFENELRQLGLSMDHTVRTRLWAEIAKVEMRRTKNVSRL
jgi:enamine deaminase RidA (YjgF/YER057c/UK114 family)